MAAPQLRPEVKAILLERFSWNTNGETAALNAIASMFCENQIKAYPANTKGVIQAILDLGRCLGAWAEHIEDELNKCCGPNGGGGADLCCLLPQVPNTDFGSAGIIGENCNTQDCLPNHPHPHDPTNPCCGTSPDVNPELKYPIGGVECLKPDEYEWVNGGISGEYCDSTGAVPDCLIPSRLPYANAGVIGCGNPTEIHWVDYYWPSRTEWCNAGFTGHNCSECLDPGLVPPHGGGSDCNVCRRGGVENYKPELIEYNNAGTWGDSCPQTFAKPTCLLPNAQGVGQPEYANSGLIGVGDPDTDNYVDYYWPARCEYANAGLIGTGCSIGGDEWLDALGLHVEKGNCYIPFLSEWSNAGIIGGSWKCDTNKKPNVGEHWFTPVWETEYANSGALLINPYEESEPIWGGVECWKPESAEYTQCGFSSPNCPERDASPGCLLPNHGEDYGNGGIVALMSESLPNWWDHYIPDCPEYDNAGVTGTNCHPPDPCCECPTVGNELPVIPYVVHDHEGWLPSDDSCSEYNNAGFKTSRACNVCEPCDNTEPHGQPVVVISDQPPIEPCEGTLWFNPSRLEMMVYYCDADTCQWVPTTATGGGTGGASVVISDAAPVGATCGDLWMDSKRMEMRTFYDDGDTRQWVPTSLAAANSPETERMLRAEVAAMRAELNELKMAIAGRSPE